jgi:hypothetical protein
MKPVTPFFESREIEQRAAEVRRRWSLTERLRRTGLPPDMPIRLRMWPASTDRALMSGHRWSDGTAYAFNRIES